MSSTATASRSASSSKSSSAPCFDSPSSTPLCIHSSNLDFPGRKIRCYLPSFVILISSSSQNKIVPEHAHFTIVWVSLAISSSSSKAMKNIADRAEKNIAQISLTNPNGYGIIQSLLDAMSIITSEVELETAAKAAAKSWTYAEP